MNLRNRLINWLTARLLVAPDSKDIITIEGSGAAQVVRVGGERIAPQLAKTLKQEALALKRMYLWEIMTATFADRARKVMFERSKSFEDMNTGKAILYVTDVQEKLIEVLEKL